MSTDFQTISDSLADVVEGAAGLAVTVAARRRYPASGTVWSADGLIVTANHVVRKEEDITVGLAGDQNVEATLVGRDPSTDIALLRVDAQALQSGEWLAEDEIRVGSLVLALGRPGRSVQASLGVVSARAGSWRTGGGGMLPSYIKPDLVMYPGFSGGPLVDGRGRIVGMTTSALVRDGGVALSKQAVQPVVETLLAHGRMRRGYLGVGVQAVRLPARVAEASDGDQETGLLVTSVETDSPAEKSGLMVGDILVQLDGVAVAQPEDLSAVLAGLAGQEVSAGLVRAGEVQESSVVVGERG